MTDALIEMIRRTDPAAFMGLMIPISAVAGTIIFGIVAMVLHHLRSARDASLKHEMIAQGMSADEIERVLAAKSSSKGH
jgi:hypothetical protein